MEVKEKYYKVSINVWIDKNEENIRVREFEKSKETNKILVLEYNDDGIIEKSNIKKSEIGKYNIVKYPNIGIRISGYTTDVEMFTKHLKLMLIAELNRDIEHAEKIKGILMKNN